jgi:O-phosphoseryl-tRNA synthetase
MAKFDVRKLKAMAKRDYERAWLESGKLIEKKGKLFSLEGKAKPHPLFDLIERARHTLLKMGFKEVVMPMIVDKKEIYAQYGPEAPVILDRVFFLAGLERPDIGISKEKLEKMGRIIPGFNKVGELKDIFRRYKKAKIASDDLIETMVAELGISEVQAAEVLSRVFPELRGLKPVSTDLTIRSHTTSLWFPTLSLMLKREPLPLQLFSVGPKFRREQRLDPTHLYESWTASVAVMAERISMEDGERLAKEVLARLGFGDVTLVYKKATSKYYAPRTEFEVFVRHSKGELIEVGDGGFYSPVALSNYDIPYPVFNLGIGLERLLMIETGEVDMRALVFPHLYKPTIFSDAELVKMVKIERGPETEVGKEIVALIARVAVQHANEPSPCEFKAFEGEILGKQVRVSVVEPESGTKLIGPAGFNEVYVYEGNVVGLPPSGWERDKFLSAVRTKGISTGVRYIDAFAALAAHEIERAAKEGKHQVKVRVRNVKLPSDINIKIDEVAKRYITTNKKRIDVRGPVFTTVVAEFD